MKFGVIKKFMQKQGEDSKLWILYRNILLSTKRETFLNALLTFYLGGK